MQPNSLGGPPGVPQALNRYAATSVGQPGVAAGITGGLIWRTAAQSALSNSTSAGLSEWGLETIPGRLAGGVSSWRWLSIDQMPGIPRRHTSPLFCDLVAGRQIYFGFGLYAQWVKRKAGWTSYKVLVRNLPNDFDYLIRRASRVGMSVRSYPFGQTAGRIWKFGPKHLTVGDFVPGIGADLIVGGLWQAISDSDLWFTDPRLAAARATHAASVNAVNGVAGLVLARISSSLAYRGLVAVGFLVNVPEPSDLIITPLALVSTIAIDIFLGEQIGNTLLNLVGVDNLDIPRNLEPLQ